MPRAVGRAALILRGWTHAAKPLGTDQDDAVPMRGSAALKAKLAMLVSGSAYSG